MVQSAIFAMAHSRAGICKSIIESHSEFMAKSRVNCHSTIFSYCGSCNRAKSWSCEHCKNLVTDKNPKVCLTCYWGSPEKYEHVAMEDVRRLDVLWQGKEVQDFDAMRNVASKAGIELPIYVKRALKERNE
jgi:hypothetical protein